MIPKAKIIRDKKHLRFIASLPCIVTGHTDVQAAHIRIDNICGMGIKPSDDCVVPLYWKEHMKQHEIGELKYWFDLGGHERASVLAKKLYEHSGDEIKCEEEIRKWKKRR